MAAIDQTIDVTAHPTAGKGLALDATGKVPRSVLPQQVTGSLDAAAGTLVGTGFGGVKNGTGDYSVTFTQAFPAAPVVVVTNTGTEQPWAQPIFTAGPSATGFRVNLRDTSNVSQNGSFQFVAFQTA